MHPVESIISTTMSQLKTIVDVNTIVGDPIYSANNTLVFPVSRVSVGFLCGGGEYETKKTAPKEQGAGQDLPFAGTAISGVTVTPKAFIAVHDGQMKVTPAECGTTLDRLVEMIPTIAKQLGETLKSAKPKKFPSEPEASE
ncbi:MAG: sporulation protein YtfJ [Clostridiales bacterium]|nr:sporulation protein YtfJ [Clostridiales bacterium]